MIRIQKFLSEAGVCSRRKAEEFILKGDIKVNDKIISELGFKVNTEKDVILFKNKKVTTNKNNKIYIMLNKPEGCVTTVNDQFNRKTVFNYVNLKEKLVPVGRLDYDTSGLLILTNDGDLVYKLTHPKHKIKKFYVAKILGTPTREKLEKFKNGLIIDDYKTSKAFIEIIKKNEKTSTVKIAISEGKNRQIRKMCQKIGHNVICLKRVAIENLTIGNLEKGEFRYLTDKEINYLKKLTY